MKLFVFLAQKTDCSSIVLEQTTIVRLRALLAGGTDVWEDLDDKTVADTAEGITSAYLDPNGIPVKAMGKFADRFWWIAADPAKICLDDFYTAIEAATAGIFVEDAGALCWKDYYIFIDNCGVDMIGSFDYLGPAKSIMVDILPKLDLTVH